ncbi:hypothetical protein N7E81_11625 [Reichenbachiella carrageenanivorans]|uniref:Uncharacterized protein n=1 Tax=Reichenbachiella carrageenanivorans TaxID=2979869 RepID=A0ABY6CVT2_9BACT|nr:hypothetical protein [Reichenbachiella carrageenanivorans]UXX78010.1 hypothetical protein N7E81_11625 [Reichenbachiella carrageenanivorans]
MYTEIKIDILENEQLIKDLISATNASEGAIKRKLSDFPKSFRSDLEKTPDEWKDYAFNWTKKKLSNPDGKQAIDQPIKFFRGFKPK